MSGATPPGTASAATVWTVLDLLRWTAGHFAERGIETARLDAECLLAHALGVDRLRLYLDFEKPVTPAERDAFRTLVRRRAVERVPVAHLVGRREFWSLPLRVTPDVLVPRPDTETLVAAVLERLPDPNARLRIADLGTGSGAVALAIAGERPQSLLFASDISQSALKIAQENAETLGMEKRILFLRGDWAAALAEAPGSGGLDAVVANPPYLATSERSRLAPELAHEPPGALFAGPRGGEVLARLAREVPPRLAPGGTLAFELGPGQEGEVVDRLAGAGIVDLRVHRDLAGRPRVVSGRRAPARSADG